MLNVYVVDIMGLDQAGSKSKDCEIISCQTSCDLQLLKHELFFVSMQTCLSSDMSRDVVGRAKLATCSDKIYA